jgi:hypothetical protein
VRRPPLVAALGALAIQAAAQGASREARIEVTLPTPAARASAIPTVRSANMLSDRSTQNLLEQGFPARLHFRLELWEARFFPDRLVSQVEWDVVALYNPLARHYTVSRVTDSASRAAGSVTPLGTFADLKAAEQAVSQAFVPTLPPPAGHKRYYYFAVLEAEMLSVSDLDALQRWLRGDLQPLVHGKEDPGTVLGRGFKTLITRLLGGETRVYRARTEIFRP